MDRHENSEAAVSNEAQIERLIACINDRKIEVMDELFHDDATMDWPQSRERVRGAENRRAIQSTDRFRNCPPSPRAG